jgi:hypothetical protein
MWIVITGTLINGLVFHGPFVSAHSASEWADSEIPHRSWEIAYMEPVDG